MAKMKLNRTRVEMLYNALMNCDGRDEPVCDANGKPMQRIVGNTVVAAMRYIPYTFGDTTIRPSLSADAAVLLPYIQVIQAGKDSLNKRLPADAVAEDIPASIHAAIATARNELGQRIMEIDGLRRVPWDKLNAETNNLPASVIAGLMPIISGFPAEVVATGDVWSDEVPADREPAQSATVDPAVNGKQHEPEAVAAE